MDDYFLLNSLYTKYGINIIRKRTNCDFQVSNNPNGLKNTIIKPIIIPMPRVVSGFFPSFWLTTRESGKELFNSFPSLGGVCCE